LQALRVAVKFFELGSASAARRPSGLNPRPPQDSASREQESQPESPSAASHVCSFTTAHCMCIENANLEETAEKPFLRGIFLEN